MLSKFLIYVDYLCTSFIPDEYIEISAKKLEDAILAADHIFDSEKHYLVSVMEKTSAVKKQDDFMFAEYTSIMTRRCGGWHLCNDDDEHRHKIARCWFRSNNCSPEPWYSQLF